MDSEARRERVLKNISNLQSTIRNYYEAGRYKIVKHGSAFLIKIALDPSDLANALELDDEDYTDRRPRQSSPGRRIRRRQELAGLRHRSKSLPRQSIRPLSSLAKTLPGHGARPRRRAPSAPDQIPRPRRSPHSRRLRPRASRRRRPSRSARNPRRALWPPIDDRHLPMKREGGRTETTTPLPSA